MAKFIRKVFPEVDNQLKRWAEACGSIGDEMLKKQALSSIKLKKFHAQGGSVYALYPKVDMVRMIKLIVAFQTISDYLDNLCDRAGVQDEASFRQLHLSMLDAVDPGRDINDYYLFYPYKNDRNYLKSLVEECRLQIGGLPSYPLVVGRIKEYVQLYSDLQVYKHIGSDIREARLIEWADSHLYKYPGISCWEFSAAAGSTLGIFALFASASDPSLTADEVRAIDKAYFPWICGLHILLDYYIDSHEDMREGDLNFTYYYSNLKECEERLSFFIERSLEYCSTLSCPKFHSTVVKGLLAMYLSDPKASVGMNRFVSRSLIKKGKSGTKLYYNLCRLLRSAGAMSMGDGSC